MHTTAAEQRDLVQRTLAHHIRLTRDPYAATPPQLAAVQPQQLLDGAVSYLNLPFGFVPGFRPLMLDLHIPQGCREPVPVVVYAHGAGLFSGSKTYGHWHFLPSAGYAVASVDFRLGSETRYPGQLHDMKAAVRWIRANAAVYGLDPGRVVIWGGSIGAVIASQLALTNGRPEYEGEITIGSYPEALAQSSEVSGCIFFYGASDFLALPGDAHPDAVIDMGAPSSPPSVYLGHVAADDPGRAASVQPVGLVSPTAPPFLLVHGDTDVIVGSAQSRRLHDALRAAGVDSELHILPGASHGLPAEAFESDEVRG
ncbi:MAG: alpha/beta hydrolase, partial [Actinobacteria bacterium]|nr:alpha/beta hydrolase [Actinomycetota bacterium]